MVSDLAFTAFILTLVEIFEAREPINHAWMPIYSYRWPYGPPSPARARRGPARRGPTDFVLLLGGTMG
jgi:hypothetical protein